MNLAPLLIGQLERGVGGLPSCPGVDLNHVQVGDIVGDGHGEGLAPILSTFLAATEST